MATILYVGTAGSDDPTRAAFPFNFALGAIEAGHLAEIFLAGEAAYVMKDVITEAIEPVGMPPLAEMRRKVIEHGVLIYVWGRCAGARGVTEADLQGKNARFVTPKVFAERVVAADKVVSC